MAKVNFIEDDSKFESVLKEELKNNFETRGSVAVKLHMGEPGNETALKPDFVKQVVDILKELGHKPFLFDSPVIYNSQRNTVDGYLKSAVERGFTKDAIGCPVKISNEAITVKGEHMEYGVCIPPTEADHVLVLTHLKGHICSGFGGAIKNLGMGSLTKETKGAIHGGGKPDYIGNCKMCGACAKACPTNNVRYENNQPFFDKTWCCGCSNCVYACKFGSLKAKVHDFDVLLAEGAKAALDNYKNVYFINVIKNITKLCDCVSNSGDIISEDVGTIMGTDIVSVEKASLDKVIEKSGKDVFLEHNKKSPLVHIEAAQKLGMGEGEYELVHR